MFIRKLKDCPEFTSGDNAILRELLNGRTDGKAYRYSLAHAVVRPGETTLPHKLKTSEVYYILQGNGLMHVDTEVKAVEADDAIDIPPHALQYIENPGPGDLVFICIVDPAWRKDDEVIF